jgi:NADH:ubiquinone oxidoreductase subunit E
MTEHAAVDSVALDEVLSRYPAGEPSLIQVLQDIHRACNYLPRDVLVKVAGALSVPLATVFSVATFYKAFALTPQGRTIVRVCTGTACHIRGSDRLIEELSRRLQIAPGQTSRDLAFTVKTVNCVGACAMAPVLIVGEKYNGNASAAKLEQYLGEGAADHEN